MILWCATQQKVMPHSESQMMAPPSPPLSAEGRRPHSVQQLDFSSEDDIILRGGHESLADVVHMQKKLC